MQSNSRTAEAISAFRRGDLDRARALAAAQVADENGPPDAHHLLGLIECRQGAPESGIQWLRKACNSEPGNVGYRIMLIRALIDSGCSAEALAIAARPTGDGPAELALWRARAEAADAIGDSEAAAEAWRAICTDSESDWRAWSSLGRNLFALNRFSEAQQAYSRALERTPGDIGLFHELGSLYERSNRPSAADALLDRALGCGVTPDQLPELWAARLLREGRARDAHQLLARSETRGDEIRWERLRVKVSDAADLPAEAFDAAMRMNHAVPDFATWRARGADYRDELRKLAKAITVDWVAKLPHLQARRERDVDFLVGFPRSGTTLLDTFLMGHPRVEVIEEQGLLVSAARAVGPLAGLPDVPLPALERAFDTYRSRLDQEVAPSFTGQVVDKAPLNMLLAPLIGVLFPGARVIFAQRHPCDCVLSAFMQSFTPNLGMASFLDIEDAADFYDAAMSLWTVCRERLPLRVHDVVYEDLVRNPAQTLEPVTDFLDLEWDQRMLAHQTTAAESQGRIANPSFDQVTQPLSDRAAGRWRRYEEQLRPVLPVLLPWAERLGYQS